MLLAGTDRHEQAELEAVTAFAAYRTDAVILVGSRGHHSSDVALNAVLSRYLDNSGRVVTFGSSARRVPACWRSATVTGQTAGRGAHPARCPPFRDSRRSAGPGDEPRPGRGVRRGDGHGRAPLGRGRPGGLHQRGRTCCALTAWDLLDREAGSCLLAVNDVMALGAITALRSLSLRVPDDVQVAGFDDIPTLRDYSPALTTFRLPLESIGEQAAALALTTDGPEHVRIDGEVVLRASAGAPRS